MKKIGVGLGIIIVLLILSIGEMIFDVVDFNCETIRLTEIGYPVRMCSVAFDDKGIIGKVIR